MKSITFGKRLTEVRKAGKIFQDALAKMVGVYGAVIGRYERDEVKPSIELVTRLAEALNISLNYLMGATDLLMDKNVIKKYRRDCNSIPKARYTSLLRLMPS